MMQRFFDIFFSGIALLTLSPLLIPVMLVLRFTGEREIFYVQERIGKDGAPFGLIKFTTMVKNSENIGAGDITIKNDPRVLPFGKFLRKTKLNELPQLINIFKGDISIVGPRPMTHKIYQHYCPKAQKTLNTIRPGLTGIGSIVFRDEETFLDGLEDPVTFYRNTIIPYKTELELWYIQNKSIKLYFMLIILTASAIIFPKGSITRKILPRLPPLPAILK